ncbi:hypothetical protein [Ottowia thiooxydans]|uniref:hypothetical protein n=1 Tax=Ottowia thiooxydans TaxID=219182 RepID=UPI00048AFA0A|nr:hypothetical protein [Ottowia thiooxydans]
MNVIDLFWHLAGFIAPALFVALGVTLLAQVFMKKALSTRVIFRQFAISFVAGLAVSVAGLVLSGHDGRMWTYVALVLVVATSQMVFRPK